MTRRNAALALGEASVAAWRPELAGLAPRPCAIDGKLHAWEWIVTRDGLIKTDALDHHAAHDLVGCQDIAWDLAGATVELALTAPEARRLAAVVAEHAGRVPDPALVALLRPCYLAFQLGRHALAIAAADPAEAVRLQRAVDRYAALLRDALVRDGRR